MMTAQQNDFLKSAVPLAQASQKQFGVPASVTLAQSILESSDRQGRWGQSQLTRECNNFFGVKAENLSDPETYQVFDTQEFIRGKLTTMPANFERYQSPADSFMDHAKLLATAKRYAPAMKVASSVSDFAQELQSCGYSTSPIYGKTLLLLIKEYDLMQYDVPPGAPAAAAKGVAA
jgi:flagellum-specific peptidoglycan hydrolase FlgJ